MAPTGMDEGVEKPKGWVGQWGGEHSVFFISFLREAPIGLFRGTDRFQALQPPPSPWAASTDHRCARLVTDIHQAATFKQHR